MNDGTKIRTALRIAFSIYTSLCVWQATLNSLGEQLNAKWLAIAVTVVIVIAGLVVDAITTYLNNDYTEAGEIGTAITREVKNDPDFVPYIEISEEETDDGDDEEEDEDGDDEIDPYEGDERGEVE